MGCSKVKGSLEGEQKPGDACGSWARRFMGIFDLSPLQTASWLPELAAVAAVIF